MSNRQAWTVPYTRRELNHAWSVLLWLEQITTVPEHQDMIRDTRRLLATVIVDDEYPSNISSR